MKKHPFCFGMPTLDGQAGHATIRAQARPPTAREAVQGANGRALVVSVRACRHPLGWRRRHARPRRKAPSSVGSLRRFLLFSTLRKQMNRTAVKSVFAGCHTAILAVCSGGYYLTVTSFNGKLRLGEVSV